MDYKVRVYIPSKKTYGYVDELKNKNITAIAKFIQANDDYGLCCYLEKLLQNLKIDNIIDKFCILLQLRGLNFNNKAVLKGRHADGNDVEYKIDIFEFIGTLLEGSEKIPNKYVYSREDATIILKLPAGIYFKNIYALLSDSVIDIEIDHKSIYKNLSKKEQLRLLLRLKKEVITDIIKYLNEINNQSDIFLIKNDSKDILLPSIRISFFNNTIFNTLKALFKIDLPYIYNKFYITLTKLGMSYSDYMDLSFIETDILLSIYKSANNLK